MSHKFLQKISKVVSIFFYISHYLATTKSQLNATTICSFSRYSIIIRISYHIIDFLTDTLNKELIIMKQNENRFFDQRAEEGRVRGANMAPKLEIHHFSDFFSTT